jgi:NADH:ubiquinone oxidoreductase subunit C
VAWGKVKRGAVMDKRKLLLERIEHLAQTWKSLSPEERLEILDSLAWEACGLDELGLDMVASEVKSKLKASKAVFKNSVREREKAKLQDRPQSAVPELSPEERVQLSQGAREKAGRLGISSDVLEEVSSALKKMGLAGEEKNAKLLYLALTSRVLERPVSVIVKGPSSGGKSFLVETVASLFPKAAYYELTSMSERALAYSQEPLVHRHLILYEAAGLSSEFGQYLLRSLLSENRVRYETVEKTADGIKPRLIEREGPTGLILTTTRNSLDPELETRLLGLTVTDTQEQTKAVLKAQANGAKTLSEAELERFRALQEAIQYGPHEVRIPYAKTLASLVSPVAVRLRRDFPQILALIKAHTLLHQNLAKDEEGRIVARIEDYRAVYGLVKDLISEGVQVSVPTQVRETVEAVEQLLAGKETVTLSEVAQALNLDRSSASRRIKRALRLGYLTNLETKSRQPMRLVLGEPLPQDEGVLPSPEKLEAEDSEIFEYPPPEKHATVQQSPDLSIKTEGSTVASPIATGPLLHATESPMQQPMQQSNNAESLGKKPTIALLHGNGGDICKKVKPPSPGTVVEDLLAGREVAL